MMQSSPIGALAELIDALEERAGARPLVSVVQSTPWSSFNFSGVRHRFSLGFNGPSAAAHAHALCYDLSYADLDLGAHILVDIAVIERRTNSERSQLILEALIIDND